MTDEKRTLIAVCMNIWVSILTFWRIDRVSPLRWSSNSLKESRSVCFRPSLNTCMPKRWTASRAK
ncbi:MAG: hypothetical protein A4E42_01252 [Methanoregulaceae archaeon PtaU1.Bin222]|nr:MAG: hypothetical protein A4E42_01252 [Methanoregulaceae archaeon PtaU1.Bin222]